MWPLCSICWLVHFFQGIQNFSASSHSVRCELLSIHEGWPYLGWSCKLNVETSWTNYRPYNNQLCLLQMLGWYDISIGQYLGRTCNHTATMGIANHKRGSFAGPYLELIRRFEMMKWKILHLLISTNKHIYKKMCGDFISNPIFASSSIDHICHVLEPTQQSKFSGDEGKFLVFSIILFST